MPEHTPPAGTLYLIATPIGHLADLSLRAVETLRAVDCIACEDTRHSTILCRHHGITTPLVSYYREKERQRTPQLLARLQAGKNIALITDAGTPGLSDPGAVLVRQARAAGLEIRAIPGASALTTALSLAGLEAGDFYFGAFLPATSQARQRALRSLAGLHCPLIFYEAPHRIHACLRDMLLVWGERQAQLFRELTKLHEEHLNGSLTQLCQLVAGGIKGELVLVVAGCEAVANEKPEDLDSLLRWYRDERQSTLRQAVSEIAADLGLPRSQIYRSALALWQEEK